MTFSLVGIGGGGVLEMGACYKNRLPNGGLKERRVNTEGGGGVIELLRHSSY